ncbi:MAG: hypothetical protein GXP40_13540 [Chloroflexi bacterium]|nr:hypothetical protein [Chloroflexota bacterium]
MPQDEKQKAVYIWEQEPEPAVQSSEPLKRDALCPQCGEGHLDYDGLLDLVCPKCGFTASGGGGCT